MPLHAVQWEARHLAHKTEGFVRCDFIRDATRDMQTTEDELLISRPVAAAKRCYGMRTELMLIKFAGCAASAATQKSSSYAVSGLLVKYARTLWERGRAGSAL